MNAIELYRDLLHSAHDFLQGTLADVTPAHFTWDPPGKTFSIGANYAHVLGAEGMAIQGLLQGKTPLAASAWAGKVVASEPPLGPGQLGRPIDLSQFGLGKQTVLFVLTAILSNASLHTGEISCLKGQQGAKGYPV